MFLGISFFDMKFIIDMFLDYDKKKDRVDTVQTKAAPLPFAEPTRIAPFAATSTGPF